MRYLDGSRFSLGLSYNKNALTLRTAVGYDQGLRLTRGIRKKMEKIWFGIGASYEFTPYFSVDIASAILIPNTARIESQTHATKLKNKEYRFSLGFNFRF